MKYLLNILILLLLFSILIKTQTPSLKRRRESEDNIGNEAKRSKTKIYNVIYYLIKSKIYYECNGFFFGRHKDVMLYYNLLNSGQKMRKNYKPKNVVKSTEVSQAPKVKIAEYDYKQLIRNNPFSSKIWPSIWSGCGYQCFSRNNFRTLVIGYLFEINEYRRIHGVSKLVEDRKLKKMAEKQASKMPKTKKLPFCNNRLFSCLSYSGNVLQANLLVKTLYDKFLSMYDWGNNGYSPLPQTQLIWKGTTLVGIGVHCENNSIIYIVFIFAPKGNIIGKYKKNVLPISEKVTHLYNLFKDRSE